MTLTKAKDAREGKPRVIAEEPKPFEVEVRILLRRKRYIRRQTRKDVERFAQAVLDDLWEEIEAKGLIGDAYEDGISIVEGKEFRIRKVEAP